MNTASNTAQGRQRQTLSDHSATDVNDTCSLPVVSELVFYSSVLPDRDGVTVALSSRLYQNTTVVSERNVRRVVRGLPDLMDRTRVILIMLIAIDSIADEVRAIVATPPSRSLARSLGLTMRDDGDHHLGRVLGHRLGGRHLIIDECDPRRPLRIVKLANEVSRLERNPDSLPQSAAAIWIAARCPRCLDRTGSSPAPPLMMPNPSRLSCAEVN